MLRRCYEKGPNQRECETNQWEESINIFLPGFIAAAEATVNSQSGKGFHYQFNVGKIRQQRIGMAGDNVFATIETAGANS